MASKTARITRSRTVREIANQVGHNNQPVTLVMGDQDVTFVAERDITVEEFRAHHAATGTYLRVRRLVTADGTVLDLPEGDWRNEVRYQEVVAIPAVGDGMHGGYGSDSYSFTVTDVNASGKTIKVKRDRQVAAEGSDYYGDQKWITVEDPLAVEQVARWSVKRGTWVISGGGHALFTGRYVHQDPHF